MAPPTLYTLCKTGGLEYSLLFKRPKNSSICH